MVLGGRLGEAEVGLILASITLRSGPLLLPPHFPFLSFFFFVPKLAAKLFLSASFSFLSSILLYLFFFFLVLQTPETLILFFKFCFQS